MREIKFRAWDKKKQRMWWNVQNAYDSLGHHCCEDEKRESNNCRMGEQTFYPSDFEDVLKEEDLIVMEFTGLLDKQSKEIYEGDILEKLDVKGVVKFDRGAFVANWDNAAHNQVLYYWDDDKFSPEIIGNIYENPELLSN